MAKKLKPGDGDGVPQNLGALKDVIRNGLNGILEMDAEIADAIERHVKPLKDARTKAWRTLKKDANVEREDLKLFHDILARQRQAEACEDEAERDRIKDNLRTVFTALAEGGQLDFIDAIEAAADASGPAGGNGAADAQKAGYEAGKTGNKGSTANPYQRDTVEHAHWATGWNMAQTDLAHEMTPGRKGRAAAAESAVAV